MGFDLYYRNLTDEDHRRLYTDIENAGVDLPADSPTPQEPERRAEMPFERLRAGGVYEGASIFVMHALGRELRDQGADELADCFQTNFEQIPPDLILEQLRGVSVIPKSPPDLDHPFGGQLLRSISQQGVELTTSHDAQAATDEYAWARRWSQFLAFLVRAAHEGDGVAVR